MKEDHNKLTLWEAFWHGHLNDEQLKELKNLSNDEVETELKQRWDNHSSKNSIFSKRERQDIINKILVKGRIEKQKIVKSRILPVPISQLQPEIQGS